MMNPSVDPACSAPVLVLGLGNRLLSDDGIGPALVDRLRIRHAGDERMEIVDGGTQGLALLGILEGRRAVLLLDAVALGAAAGHVHLIADPLNQAMSRGQSAHEDNVSDLLRVADLLGSLPSSLVLVGIEPDCVETGIGFSASVGRSLPAALDLAEEQLRRMLDLPDREETPCTR